MLKKKRWIQPKIEIGRTNKKEDQKTKNTNHTFHSNKKTKTKNKNKNKNEKLNIEFNN